MQFYTAESLIDFLKTMPKDSIILMSSDAEGNQVSAFGSVSADHTIAKLTKEYPNLKGLPARKKAILLYPND